ncbi:MAG: sortase [Chloroflexi bacterium]|nr:sortase [Chloroflexota bacterium]
MKQFFRSWLFLSVLATLVFSLSHSVQAQSLSTPPQINGFFTPDTIYPSQVSRLTINVFNPDSSSLTATKWTVVLPDDLVVVTPKDLLVSGCGSGYTITAVPGSKTISLGGATVAGTSDPVKPGTCSVTVNVTSFTVGNHTNSIDHTSAENSAMLNGSPISYQYDAQITLLVLPMSDPSVTKSFTPAIVQAGETSLMEIDIKNNDANVALTQVALADNPLPAPLSVALTPGVALTNCGAGALSGSTDAGVSWHAVVAGDTSLRLTGASVAVGKTCQVKVNVSSASTGILTNTIHPVDLSTYQKVTIPSNVSVNLTVKNIEISKSFSPVNVQAGGSSVVTITLTNPDAANDLTSVAFTDTLLTNLTVVSGSGSLSGTGCLGTVYTSVAGAISFNGGTIPAGGDCTVTATVSSATPATYTNTLSCKDGDLSFDKNGAAATPGCADASATLTVYPTAEGVYAVKSFSPVDIAPGGSTILTIKVTAPADTDLTSFTVTDNLPTNVTVFSTPAATQDQCGPGTFAPAAGASTISLTGGTLLKGKTCTLTVRVTSSTYGDHTNTISPADITNAEPRHIPSAISAAFNVRDIAVSKSFASSSVGKNGITRLTLTLTNTNSVPLTALAFTDTLPGTVTDGLILATPVNMTNTCGGTVTATAGTQAVSLSGGTLSATSSCAISVDVQGTSSSNPVVTTKYTNAIPIGGVTGKVNGTTDTQNWHAASADLTVTTPEFRINKKFDPILVTGDTASTMIITLVNPGGTPITQIGFTDTFPANMLLASPPNPTVGSCGGAITATTGGNTFTFSGGSLAGGASCTLTIQAKLDVTGNRINTIAVGAVSTRQGATNSQPTSATLTNLSSIDLTKKFSPNPVSPGDVSQLTLTFKKVGIGIGLTGLGVSDTLSGGLTIASSPAPVNTCGGTLSAPAGGTLIQLTGGVMGISTTTCSISVNVAVDPTGLHSYPNCIGPGSVSTNEGYTNVMEACDTLGTIFDPPSGIKTFNAAGLPELEWTMVWINSSNSAAINAQITDPIPAGTTYVSGSITCEARGSSTTTTCAMNGGNVFWQGTIGPDPGATDEAGAANEVVIVFHVSVPESINQINNQATSLTDTDGDGDFTDETSPVAAGLSNAALWDRFDPNSSSSGKAGKDRGIKGVTILPNTGFAPNVMTALAEQPADYHYLALGELWLEIPTLDVTMNIVGVPQTGESWDVSWLSDQAGWLQGTAFPTWQGNIGLTGHVSLSSGLPGPFVDLQKLKWGDQIVIHAYGQKYRYDVRSVKYISPYATSVLAHKSQPWITLLTCKEYDQASGAYRLRTAVQAVFISASAE